jgi:outer membrane protein OmpA-like peptidoglycan-associated protein
MKTQDYYPQGDETSAPKRSNTRGWLAGAACFLFFAGILVGTIFICRHHYDKLDNELMAREMSYRQGYYPLREIDGSLADAHTHATDPRAGGLLVNGQYAGSIPVIYVSELKTVGNSASQRPENYVYYFPNAGSDVPGNNALDKLAGLIARSGASVSVTGYTDPTGNAAFNQRLSEQRAQHVAQYLEAHGVPESKVTVKGGGVTSAYPDYALDRRAEIKIDY